MIFLLRVIIFSALIASGFAVAVKSVTGKKIVTVIYTLTLLWYTLLCRLPLFTSVPVAADDTGFAQQTVAEPTVAEKFIRLVVSVFGSQPDGTLAGGGVGKALVFNAMLFVPASYLLLLWIPKLREKRKGRIAAVAVCLLLSVVIECVQEVTGLGMADWRDILGNTIGAAVGVGMVYLRDRMTEKRRVWKSSKRGGACGRPQRDFHRTEQN